MERGDRTSMALGEVSVRLAGGPGKAWQLQAALDPRGDGVVLVSIPELDKPLEEVVAPGEDFIVAADRIMQKLQPYLNK